MATKQSSLGTILEWDPANGTSFADPTLVKDATPPAREREEAEGRCLADLLDVPVQGGEAQSEFVFNQFWHPGDTEHEKLDTAFSDATNPNGVGDVVAFRLTYPHGGTDSGSTAPTDTFSGYIRRLGPAILEATGVFMREVIIRRTTDITRATRLLP